MKNGGKKIASKRAATPVARLRSVPAAGDESSRPATTMERQTSGAPPMHLVYNDLREWIAEAKKLGEIEIVRGASWQEDIGMAAEIAMHSDAAPCVIFDDVPGCPKGFRVLSNFFGGKRKNMTLGYETGLSKLELSEAFLQNSLKEMKTIPYREVGSGPIL